MRRIAIPFLLLTLTAFAPLIFSQTDDPKPAIPKDLKKFVVGDPPQASARVTLPPGSKLLNRATLGGSAQALSEALNAGGYADQKWFVVSHDGTVLEGIAVMTRLERIDDAAKPVATDRFSQDPFVPEVTSLTEYFRLLLSKSSRGRYRSFFFYLTFVPSPRQQAPPQVGQMNSAFLAGASGGPAFDRISISLPLTCTAYIYEFDRNTADGQVTFVDNDALSGRSHLVAADLWKELGPD
jgi:hypothetical protein